MDLGAAPVVPHPAEVGELVQLSQSHGWGRACAKPSLSWEHQPSTARSCALARTSAWFLLLHVFTENAASLGQFSSLSHFFIPNPWSWGMPHLGMFGTLWVLAVVRALGLISELGKGQQCLRGSPKSSHSCCDASRWSSQLPWGAGLGDGAQASLPPPDVGTRAAAPPKESSFPVAG